MGDAQLKINRLAEFFANTTASVISETDSIDKYIAFSRLWMCRECNKKFKIKPELLEKMKIEQKDPQCPKCGSDKLKKGRANATINRDLACLKRMFNLGVKCKPRKVYVMPVIEMLPEHNVREGFFESVKYDKFIEYLPPLR